MENTYTETEVVNIVNALYSDLTNDSTYDGNFLDNFFDKHLKKLKVTFSSFKKELTSLLVFLPVERPDWEQDLNDFYTEYKENFHPRNYSIEEFANDWFIDWDTKTHHCMLKSKAIANRDERIKNGERPIL